MRDVHGSPVRSESPAIVGIGASAGGLEAFTRLLRALPSDTGLAYVLVQHLAPGHESQLPEILDRAASIPITQARDGLRLEANHAYVIPPNTTMTVADGHLRIVQRSDRPRPHLPIDTFLTSLAEVHGSAAAGVILSGAGSDGARGIQALKEVGGLTFAQDSASAGHASMPEAAVATGSVDFVLPPEAIASRLAEIGRFVGHVAADHAQSDDAAPARTDELKTLLQLLRQRTGVDFSDYRAGTIRRRILRRMLVARLRSHAEYVAYARDNPAELDSLYEDLLIGVSSFFRDPEVFTELRETGFPQMLRDKPVGAPLRIWVAGCSGGEETYSLAIALLEFLDQTGTAVPIHIFATDLSETSIARARAAIYPESISENVSSERLQRFFVHDHGKYRIAKAVRDLCVFSRHNIARDPPFSHLDLISCRNVLIYFDPALQRRVFPIFHYALEPHGLLLLGSAETPGAGGGPSLFEPIAKRHKLFRRRSVPTRGLDLDFRSLSTEMAPRGQATADAANVRDRGVARSARSELTEALERVVLGNFAQQGVIVDEQLSVVHFRGDTSKLLSHAPETATLNLLQLARAELVAPLRLALTRAMGNGQPTREAHVALSDAGETRHVAIDVFPIPSAPRAGRTFAILFTDEPGPASMQESAPRSADHQSHDAREPASPELRSLRDELAAIKTYVAGLIKEHEATVEELQAAGEEIQSSNEELQSTNEELETTKEEIESTNEELTTLNEELSHRNRELGDLASDLANVFASTNVPIIIVGRDLRIRRFTPVSTRVMRLIPTDVGRPLGDVRLSFTLPSFEHLVKTSIETLAVTEHLVHDDSNHWWSLTIRPYQTVDRRVDGAVLVFNDIDTTKRAEERAANTSERRRQALAVSEEARIVALAKTNEALAIGIAERERADADRNELLRRLDSAEEEERRRLSRELHDEAGQHLTALGLGLQALSDIAPPDSEVDRRAAELRRLANELGRDLHEVAVRLRPKILDDFGFEAALSSFVDEWSRRTGIDVDLQSSPEAERLPPSVESAAYRIAQEALTNVAKHSGATRASVVVSRRDSHLHTIIEDNGKGFDPGKLRDSATSSAGLGLLGIRERVALLGGTFQVESGPGRGTTVFVRLPIELPAGRDAGPGTLGSSDG